MRQHILLAVDDSPASRKIAEYVGEMLQLRPGGRRKGDECKVTILHITPRYRLSQYATAQALAPDMQMPKYEYGLESEHDIAVSAVKMRRPTDDARELLVDLGVPYQAINIEHRQAGPAMDVARMIVDTAHKLGCDTIAVGRNRDTRFLRSHISDAVIKRAQDIPVWVVQ